MKFTLALPLLCAAAAVGPAAAADVTPLRMKTKISDDAASASAFPKRSRRVQDDADVAEMRGEPEICADKYPNAGFAQALYSKRMAFDIWNTFIDYELKGCGPPPLEEDPSTSSLPGYSEITKANLRLALSGFPTLAVFLDAVTGADQDCTNVYEFAGQINSSVFEDMDCDDFEDFLEKMEHIYESVKQGWQYHFFQYYD